MNLYRNGAFVADEWSFIGEDEALISDRPVVVSKARFLKERAAFAEHHAPLGLVLQAGEDLEGIEGDLVRLSLIALTFPKFSDGRAYSIAHLLRQRHGFTGEVRARGDVLQDQIGFMLRAGFNALEISHAGTIAALKAKTITSVSIHYQPASLEGEEPRPTQTRSWLRQAR